MLLEYIPGYLLKTFYLISILAIKVQKVSELFNSPYEVRRSPVGRDFCLH